MVRSHLLHVSFSICLTLFGTLSLADLPCVQFDVAPTVDAIDASTPAFLTANPSEKLIRIQVPISSFVRIESEDSLLQFVHVISGTTTDNYQVVDYAPRTTLASDVDGPINVENSSGSSTNLGLIAAAPREFPLKADLTAGRKDNSNQSRRLQKLPPLQLLSASGTMHRGLSVYFKLKPSTQTTLEGDKLFEVVARVPYNWRAGLIHVNCAAFGKSRAGGQSNVVCGQNRFVVGVYMAGDEVARNSVRNLAATQRQLRVLAKQHANSIQDERYPSWGHKIGAALSVVKPRIPDRWLDELLTTSDYHAYERHLPRKVRMAATEYREARKQVIGFAG